MVISVPPVPRMVICPSCGKQVAWAAENSYRPFCSERCKAIDLGAWAAEEYRVPEQPQSPDGTELL